MTSCTRVRCSDNHKLESRRVLEVHALQQLAAHQSFDDVDVVGDSEQIEEVDGHRVGQPKLQRPSSSTIVPSGSMARRT